MLKVNYHVICLLLYKYFIFFLLIFVFIYLSDTHCYDIFADVQPEIHDEGSNQFEGNDPQAAQNQAQLQDPVMENLVRQVLQMQQEPNGRNIIFTIYF